MYMAGTRMAFSEISAQRNAVLHALNSPALAWWTPLANTNALANMSRGWMGLMLKSPLVVPTLSRVLANGSLGTPTSSKRSIPVEADRRRQAVVINFPDRRTSAN
jgi:hypothetical protein